ncbi:MAG: peptidylprolyl isomerase [Flavobacteriaceae bacterium]|nr:peptidylprolyl isomerase [Flavobacteriaceae bacterium]
MRRIKSLLLVLITVIISCESQNKRYPGLENGLYAEIETESGAILLNLEFEKVPLTVANFVSLAEGENEFVSEPYEGKRFYDGLKFHRVISKANGSNDDFMIQGGCPFGTGTGNPGYKFKDEFPLDTNGNFLFKHDKKGVLSMANSGPNSNGSQFFITLSERSYLDGVHTVFGNVEQGQEVVDSLKVDTKIDRVTIIRVGGSAKSFDAPEIIEDYFSELEKASVEEQEQMKKTVAKFAKIEKEATELSPDFKIFFTKKGEGPQPKLETKIRISYAVYFTNGKLLDTNMKDLAMELGVYDEKRDRQNGYMPFPSTYSMNEQLIQGFKEGLQEMQFGDQIVLFIPYHLAYGEQESRGVPAKSDLIFELEMLPPL